MTKTGLLSGIIWTMIGEQMEPVGVVDLDDFSFTFESNNGKLIRLLKGIKEQGVMDLTQTTRTGGTVSDQWSLVKVTSNTAHLLNKVLMPEGFIFWSEGMSMRGDQ